MSDAGKTTYNTLANNSSDAAIAGFNALVNTATPSHKADLQRRLTDAIRYSAPAIGDYWNGQGGYYAGIVRDGDKQWHLILADELVDTTTVNGQKSTYSNRTGTIKSAWGAYLNEIPGEFSRCDGQHNTALILAAEPDNKIASHFTALLIDGHKDCYWPSQFEQNLLLINLPEHLEKTWHWSSTQYSAGNAWGQGFEDGYQGIYDKDGKLAARAVRRLAIE